MKTIKIVQATKNEIAWINLTYEDVGFVKSDFDNEFIVIAKVNNQNAGIGRLVKIDRDNVELGGIYVLPNFRGLGAAEKIVSNLCKKNPFIGSTIWCLPFENLYSFYAKFGFKNCETQNIPQEVIKKHAWCNSENRYEKKVLLLCKNG